MVWVGVYVSGAETDECLDQHVSYQLTCSRSNASVRERSDMLAPLCVEGRV